MPEHFASFDQFETWMGESFGQEKFHPGLDRLKTIFKDQQQFFKKNFAQVITIAGTNGKGETVHYLKEILKYNKKTFKAFTSPHILSISERFESDQGLISLDELNLFHQKLVSYKNQLTYFEYLFGLFVLWSMSQKIDYILLEVGLGGRLDAVNLFDADLVLLTSISRDHQEVLGSRLKDILREKYGVTRTGKTLISNLQSDYLKQTLKNWCQRDQIRLIEVDSKGKSFSVANYRLASKALEGLTIPAFIELKKRSLVGKIAHSNCTLFGSHNIDGIRKLVQKLQDKTYNFDKTVLAFSKRSEQDIKIMIKILKSCHKTENILLTDFNHAKASSLKNLAERLGIPYEQNWKSYLKKHKKDSILVTGSYYFIAQVHHFLKSSDYID